MSNSSAQMAYSRSHLPLLRAFSDRLNNTPIKTFCYLRLYKDGKLLYLSNNDSWLKTYISEGYYNLSEHTKCYTANGKGGYYTWLGNDTDLVLLKAKELNILNGVNACRQQKDFCEAFVFSSSIDHPDFVNYYTNNTPEIKNIQEQFYNEYLKRFTINKRDLLSLNLQVTKQINECCDIYERKVLSKVMLEKNTAIGKKALACLYWTCHGKSADEIAQILKISRRTVEDHFSSLKIKLNCTNKYELIYKILSRWPNIINDYQQ